MPKGNLLKVIQNEPNIQVHDMIHMAKQAASGMAYLEKKRIIHRDLALRNLLVNSSANSNYVIKVAGTSSSSPKIERFWIE